MGDAPTAVEKNRLIAGTQTQALQGVLGLAGVEGDQAGRQTSTIEAWL